MRSDVVEVPFGALLSAIKSTEGSVPEKLTRQSFAGLSGSTRSALMASCRSLGLIDEQDRPTDVMRTLIQSYGEPSFKANLATLLRTTFEDALDSELDLSNARRSDVDRIIARQHPGCGGAAIRSTSNFFLNAVGAAEMVKGTRPHRGRASPPPQRPEEEEVAMASVAEVSRPGKPTGSSWKAADALMALLQVVYDPESMPEGSDADRAVMTLVRTLRRRIASG